MSSIIDEYMFISPDMKWLERTWNFDLIQGRYSEMVATLAESPTSFMRLVNQLDPSVTSRKLKGKWSINEHAGHLLTMESLWIARLDDLVLGRPTLRPWNGTNADTEAAQFNGQRLGKILEDFQEIREMHTNMLQGLAGRAETMIAFHERLDRKMNLTEHVYFMLEHDLHHLRAVENIIYQEL